MIKLLDSINPNDFLKLENSHYARRVKSNFEAYGTKYDFCRFYELVNNDKIQAIISQFNSTMVVSDAKDTSFDNEMVNDLFMLISMNKPQTIEMNVRLAEKIRDKLDDYNKCDRTEFQFVSKNYLPSMEVDECPRLDDVFAILKTAFPQ